MPLHTNGEMPYVAGNSVSARGMSPERSTASSCPVCRSAALGAFFDAPRMPVLCNQLWPTREAARRAPAGDIRLSWCRACGHLFNAAFDPDSISYTSAYDNALHFSPRFRAYAEEVAAHLVERYALRGKTVVEIGCGDGYFLQLLCEGGRNRGVGFEPSGTPQTPAAGSVTLIPDAFSDRHAGYRPDLVCCRQVLEHVPQPTDFLRDLRRTLGDGSRAALFFEVPNGLYMLGELAVWDVIYEHPSYFTPASLAHAFAAAGFGVRSVTEGFGRQFLCVEAAATGPAVHDLAAPTTGGVAAFAQRAGEREAMVREQLGHARGLGQRAIVWGAGSKGVTLLNRLGVRDQVEYVVDVNPRKQDRFIPGTGQRVVAPGFLREYQPHLILLPNPIYAEEVQQQVRSLGVTAKLICV
jgi:SAM-dependent methyltransferase